MNLMLFILVLHLHLLHKMVPRCCDSMIPEFGTEVHPFCGGGDVRKYTYSSWCMFSLGFD